MTNTMPTLHKVAIACCVALVAAAALAAAPHARAASRNLRLFEGSRLKVLATDNKRAATVVVFLTSGTSWTVPTDWTTSGSSVEVVGGGAGGNGGGYSTGDGGGGGAYSKAINVALTAGNTVTYAVGAGGATDIAGGDTYFCNSIANCASIAGTAVVAGAKGGTLSAGGAAASGIGTTKFSGGSGGLEGNNLDNLGGGGGGGAGGRTEMAL